MISTFIILFIVFVTMALFEAPGLIQKKHWRDLLIFGALWSLTFFLSILLALDVKLPNPQILVNALTIMVINFFK